jgi:large subunit ribosomal protein L18
MDEKKEKRIRRHKRIRRKVRGTKDCPRISVYRSLANICVQLIDDTNQKTLLCASTHSKDFKNKNGYGGNAKAASVIGKILAEGANNKGITTVVFDRGGFLYHGRIRALAESCREHGLKF